MVLSSPPPYYPADIKRPLPLTSPLVLHGHLPHPSLLHLFLTVAFTFRSSHERHDDAPHIPALQEAVERELRAQPSVLENDARSVRPRERARLLRTIREGGEEVESGQGLELDVEGGADVAGGDELRDSTGGGFGGVAGRGEAEEANGDCGTGGEVLGALEEHDDLLELGEVERKERIGFTELGDVEGSPPILALHINCRGVHREEELHEIDVETPHRVMKGKLSLHVQRGGEALSGGKVGE